MAQMASVEIEARRAALRASTLFAVLQPAELDAVLAQASIRRASRHEVLLRRGDASTGALVIVAGRVRIGLMSEEGGEVTLGVLGPGEVVGEMALLDGKEVSADATALEDCVLLAIERTRFLRLLHDSSDLCLRLMTVLCGRLRASNAALEELALLDLPARLGRLLQRLARDYGFTTPHGMRIEVRLSQKDLATLVGASREKVNRQLREWEEAGVLGKDGGRIVIQRAEALAAHV
ncbi:MAG: Crp/Fnr family transcriptional regulator [Alphaproteobacteria bacterium]|nr:Crp/Fnr family transcriptional regulator [Alphaproteobacteria bacterium]